jgi:hypothetical protein
MGVMAFQLTGKAANDDPVYDAMKLASTVVNKGGEKTPAILVIVSAEVFASAPFAATLKVRSI